MKNKVRCWEFFDCHEKACPVYQSKELNCWVVSGTHCRNEIQGKFVEKAEMCLGCEVFEANMDVAAMGQTVKVLSQQFETYKSMVEERDREWETTSMELALGLSEVFVALKEIASGNPDVRVNETSDLELLSKLKHMVNETAQNIGEIVGLSHEFAMGLAEYFDALHRVSTGDLSARVTGHSQIELLEHLKEVTNETIESVSREIAERKEQEAAVRESEARFRNMADNAPVMIWVTEVDGSCSFVSKSWCGFTGQTEDAALGFGWLDAIHPDDLERSKNAFFEANQKHEAFQLEYRVRRADGQYRWAIDAATPRLGSVGQFLGYVGSVFDISERKEAEEAVRFERQQLLSIFDSINQVIYISDPHTYEILYVNDKAREVFNKPLIGEVCYRAFQGLDAPCAFCTNGIIQERKYKPYEWEHTNPVLKRDFMVIDRIMKWPDGRDVRFEIAIDITERKEAEEALRASERRYAQLVQESPDAIISLDRTGNFLSFNQAAERMTGFSEAEVVGKHFAKIGILKKESIPKAVKEFILVMKGKERLPFEVTVKRKDGSFLFMEANPQLIRHEGKKPWVQVVLRDITERKRAEEALKASEERYRTLFDSSHDALMTLAPPSWRFTSGNPACVEMFGARDEADFASRGPWEYSPEFQPDGIASQDKAKEMIETAMQKGSHFFEWTHQRLDGTAFPATVLLTRIVLSGHEQLQATVRDITEQRQLEDRLGRAQKMEAVATLVGGLAHDFNNLLSMTMGNISMAKDDVEPEHGIYQFLDEAEKASMRAKDLTRRLVAFADGGTPVKRVVNMKELLKGWVDPAQSDSNVSCEFSMAENLWPIECDEGQMRFVVNNLVVNAGEAMPHGGTIKVHAENLVLNNNNKTSDFPVEDGEYLHISIRDDGMGIPEKDLPRIFDPYFSTKEMGTQKGMGLGLSTAYSIIDRHKGHITVESEKGVGTDFHIYLPACPEGTVETEHPGKEEGDGRGKVLMMDDEEMLRNLTKQMLIRLGYETETAEDGSEAVEKYKEARDSGKPFDAVVLDLTIRGGMGGKATMEALLGIDPQVKAIACSGFCEDSVMENCRQHGFRGSLLKPFRKRDLEDVLREVMGEASK